MIKWEAEACDLLPDAVSGAAICRLTRHGMHSTNFYYEQPYGSPDGSRIAYGRSVHADPRVPPTELGMIDLRRLRVASIDKDIVSTWFATSPWSGKIHYLRSNGELIRVDIMTMEKTIVQTHWPLPSTCNLWSVTPDMRYMVSSMRHADYHTEIIRIDLETAEWEVIYRQHNVLGHMQINPANGRDLLVQVNRGMAMDHHARVKRFEEEHEGATHIVVDLFTGKARQIPVGEPWTFRSTGHASWLGNTGRMITPVHWPGMSVAFHRDEDRPPHDARHPQGNLVMAGPDDDEPWIFPAPDHLFDHSSASKCGRYFVADCVCHGIPGKVEIVAGNLETGKHRVLVSDTGATMGGPAASHVHPYLTADNAEVIYTADPDGLAQVYKATVPEGFWESLD